MNVGTLRAILNNLGPDWHDGDDVLLDLDGRLWDVEMVTASERKTPTPGRTLIVARIGLDRSDLHHPFATHRWEQTVIRRTPPDGRTPDKTAVPCQALPQHGVLPPGSGTGRLMPAAEGQGIPSPEIALGSCLKGLSDEDGGADAAGGRERKGGAA